MNMIRLGDRIENLQRPIPLGKSYATAEYLAQKVFNPSPDRKDIADYYIQSRPLAERPSFMELFPDGTPNLGEYEVKIIGKLLDPQRPVLVIVGPLGSGKTTLKNYTALNLVQNRKHCEKCIAPRQRLIAHIDFNEHTNLNSITEDCLNSELYKILRDELQSRLNLAMPLTEQEEFGVFWLDQIAEFSQQKSSSMAFRFILSHALSPQVFSMIPELEQEILEERKALLGKLIQFPELHLDYLVRLWRFIIQYRYCGSHSCGFVLLDNLDRVHPSVQRKVIEVTHTHARMGGPTFMILVRPETFDIVGLGTGIIDVEYQNGPSPYDVILAHLNKFCANPESYFSLEAGFPHPQFEILVRYFEHIHHALQNDTHQVFSKFINSLCGRSIRIGHLVAQSLFYASRAEMSAESVNVHDLVRLCIRGDSPQLKWRPNGFVEHLFRISTQTSNGLLIKPRILRYLGRSERERRKFGEIHNVLTGFGYDASTVTDALNDLMNTNHQLARSNGFDYYGDRDPHISAGDNIKITEKGKGYANYLLSDLDYIQEVMLDTYVDGDHFPQSIGFNYLIDKFKLVYQFLDEIRKVDRNESERFVEKWGVIPYKEAFGDHLITLDIIRGIYPSTLRILKSLPPTYERSQLLSDFKSLMLLAEHDNDLVLRVSVDSISEF